MTKVILKTILVAICIFFTTNRGVVAQNESAVPRFDISANCMIPVPAGEKMTCGYLSVFENRSRKNGKTIRLPIIILKSDSPNPKPDPVLRTLGGPGGSSLKMVTGRRFSPWLKERDMIIFEQRGTKYAQPALECPEVGEALVNSIKLGLGAAASKKSELEAASRCRARLIREGIDLAAYNSAESAADIEDLRRVLKLAKINLFGISYSARLMLNVMRDYPAGIRSAVLESTLPLEVNYDEVGVDKILEAIRKLFAACRADVNCDKKFPKLDTDFFNLIRSANSAPISVIVKDPKGGGDIQLNLNGHDVVTWFADYVLSTDGRVISTAPLQIYRLIGGDSTPLREYAISKLSPPFYSLGMRYSVWCREETPFENYRKIREQSRALLGYEVQSLPDICRVWDVPPAKKIENQLVKSDIPTLILGAQYDAYTPPEWGKATSENLKNSFFVEIPWVGHGPSFNSPLCVNDMIAKFFDDPASRPGRECIDKIEKYFKFQIAGG